MKIKRGLVTLISLVSSAVISLNSLNGCFYSEQTRPSERAERVRDTSSIYLVKPTERAERVRDTSSIYLVKPEIAQIIPDKSYNIYIRKDGGFLEVLYNATYAGFDVINPKDPEKVKLQYLFVHHEGKSHMERIMLDDIYRIEEAKRR